MQPDKLDSFTRAYITAALWSSNDESTPSGGVPFDQNYGPEDLAPETVERMARDCAKFQAAQGDKLTEENCKYTGCPAIEYAGHDFWLTRCGHGAGFWDGDWVEPVATELTDAAHAFGNVDLYLGDDGQIYLG